MRMQMDGNPISSCHNISFTAATTLFKSFNPWSHKTVVLYKLDEVGWVNLSK